MMYPNKKFHIYNRVILSPSTGKLVFVDLASVMFYRRYSENGKWLS
jgi:hypothetical protein